MDDKSGATVKFPPPLIFIFWILIGFGLQRVIPVEMIQIDGIQYFGIFLIIFAFSMAITASVSIKRAKTSLEPWKPTSTIISSGVFAYSRNPIYTAFCIVPLGLGILQNNLWIVASLIPTAISLYFLAIKKEEIYLEKKFGKGYLDYKNKVRRWM
jgi:protein-S-isoprenylcysteine O-methyltransferase Ste14